MIIAIPKELLPGENRVACVPDVASKLIKSGFEVIVETNAGLNAGFRDDQYIKAGAKIANTVEELYSNADIIFKVQRPIEHPSGKHEIDLYKKGSLLISLAYVLHYYDIAKKMCREGN